MGCKSSSIHGGALKGRRLFCCLVASLMVIITSGTAQTTRPADGSLMRIDAPPFLAASGDENWSGIFAANGTNGTVYALATDGQGNLYVGGDFTEAGGVPANNVARWNNGWSALGAGTGGPVYTLAVAPNGTVYAGGSFLTAGTGVAPMSPVGMEMAGRRLPGAQIILSWPWPLPATVPFTREVNSRLPDVNPANHVACWNGSAWSSLEQEAATGPDKSVRALVVDGSGTLFAGGLFSQGRRKRCQPCSPLERQRLVLSGSRERQWNQRCRGGFGCGSAAESYMRGGPSASPGESSPGTSPVGTAVPGLPWEPGALTEPANTCGRWLWTPAAICMWGGILSKPGGLMRAALPAGPGALG